MSLKELSLKAAEQLERSGNVSEAREILEGLVGIEPTNTEAWIDLVILLNRYGFHSEAAAALNSATNANSHSADLTALRAHFYEVSGRRRECLSVLESIDESKLGESGTMFASRTLDKLGKQKRREQMLKSVIDRGLASEDILVDYVSATLKQGDYEAAAKASHRALQLLGSNPRILLGHYQVLSVQGKRREALVALNSAYEIDPLNRYVLTSQAYELALKQEFRAAQALIDKCPSDAFDLSKYWVVKGMIAASVRNMDQALEFIDKAMSISPTNLDVLRQAASLYRVRGFTASAPYRLRLVKEKVGRWMRKHLNR